MYLRLIKIACLRGEERDCVWELLNDNTVAQDILRHRCGGGSGVCLYFLRTGLMISLVICLVCIIITSHLLTPGIQPLSLLLLFKKIQITFFLAVQGTKLSSLFLSNSLEKTCITTGNSAECYVAAWMGGDFGGEWILVQV